MKYIRVIRMSGSFFAREFEKKDKDRKNFRYREVDEKTVADQFLKGEADIEVIFEDSQRDPVKIELESDRELIKRYLGERFLP